MDKSRVRDVVDESDYGGGSQDEQSDDLPSDDSELLGDVDEEKLRADREKPLYPGCDDYTVRSFVSGIMDIKNTHKMTNRSIDMLMELLSETLDNPSFPKNLSEANRLLRDSPNAQVPTTPTLTPTQTPASTSTSSNDRKGK